MNNGDRHEDSSILATAAAATIGVALGLAVLTLTASAGEKVMVALIATLAAVVASMLWGLSLRHMRQRASTA